MLHRSITGKHDPTMWGGSLSHTHGDMHAAPGLSAHSAVAGELMQVWRTPLLELELRPPDCAEAVTPPSPPLGRGAARALAARGRARALVVQRGQLRAHHLPPHRLLLLHVQHDHLPPPGPTAVGARPCRNPNERPRLRSWRRPYRHDLGYP